MRKVTYGGACSLDGFITGPDGAVDWLVMSPDVHAIMEEFWKKTDTLLMGRKTWDVAKQYAGQPMPGMEHVKSYVFSRRLDRIDSPGVTLVRDDAAAFVRQLRKERGGEICVFGGGELATSLLQAGVVDEVGFNIQPVLVGSGTPAFRDTGRVKLELLEARPLRGGCVYALYRVKKPGKAQPS